MIRFSRQERTLLRPPEPERRLDIRQTVSLSREAAGAQAAGNGQNTANEQAVVWRSGRVTIGTHPYPYSHERASCAESEIREKG